MIMIEQHTPSESTIRAAVLSVILVGLVCVVSLLFLDQAAAAFTGGIPEGAAAARGNDQPATLFGDLGIFSKITNVMLFIIGAVSVIMVIIGGLRYVISGGDSAKITAAKNTILYAIVGIIISLLAYALVNFVIGNFAEGSSGGDGGFSTSSSGNATDF